MSDLKTLKDLTFECGLCTKILRTEAVKWIKEMPNLKYDVQSRALWMDFFNIEESELQ